MSIQALNWALSQDQIENSGARFVLLVLSNYANEAGQCYPSRETIAKKTSMSVRAVQNHINWLAEHGYLSWENKRTDNQQQSPNIYQLKKPSADSAQYTSVREPLRETIVDVFNFWKTTMHLNGGTKLTTEREAKIKARLNDGYTVDRIKSAIIGCSVSPHHMGQNEQKTVYNDIELICRTGAKLEAFENKCPRQAFLGCDICRNHPNRKLVSLKTFGWIFNTETRQLEDCICKNGTTQRQN